MYTFIWFWLLQLFLASNLKNKRVVINEQKEKNTINVVHFAWIMRLYMLILPHHYRYRCAALSYYSDLVSFNNTRSPGNFLR